MLRGHLYMNMSTFRVYRFIRRGNFFGRRIQKLGDHRAQRALWHTPRRLRLCAGAAQPQAEGAPSESALTWTVFFCTKGNSVSCSYSLSWAPRAHLNLLCGKFWEHFSSGLLRDQSINWILVICHAMPSPSQGTLGANAQC